MAEDIGKVSFGVEANFDDKGIRKAESAIEDLSKSAKSSESAFSSLGGFYDRFARKAEEMTGGLIGTSSALITVGKAAAITTAAIVSGIGILGSMAVSAAQAADELDRLSQRTGISTDTLQQYSLVLNRNDMSQAQFATSLQQLSKRMEDLNNPTSQIGKAFRQLGLEMGPNTPADQAFEAIAKKIAALPDGMHKAAIAMQIFGRSGGELIPIMNEIGSGMGNVKARAEELGIVMGTSQIKALKDLDTAWDDLKKTMEGFVNNVGSLVAPVFTPIAEAITTLIGKVSKLTQEWAKSPMGAKELNKLPQDYVDKQQALIDQAKEKRGLAGAAAMQADMQAGLHGGSAGDKMVHAMIRKQRQPEFNAALDRMQSEIGKGVEDQKARNAAFGNQVMQDEQVNNLQFTKPTSQQTSFLDQQIKDAQALMKLMPELEFHEANLLAIHNKSVGTDVINGSKEYQKSLVETSKTLDVLADTTESYAAQSAAVYQEFGSIFGNVQKARVDALTAIDARQDASAAKLQSQLANQEISWDTYYQKILQLDINASTQRENLARQFPTFIEQQLQAIVQSNSFSMASLISSWSGGIAQIAVHGGNLVQIWQQTQVAIVQAAINGGVQLLAQAGIWAATEVGMTVAKEQAKTAAVIHGAAARELILGKEATAEVGLMAGAQATILGLFGAVQGALKFMFVEMLLPAIIAVGNFIMGVLTAIAKAMAGTIFGIPAAIVIMAGVALIGVAIAAGVGAFASGGIVTGPTMGMIGEAGDSEAIIPLNKSGASFMSEMLGMGGGSGGGEQTIYVMLDGRTIAEVVGDKMLDRIYIQAGVS